ncbi:hypothetical protein C8F04DRAFT_1268578 [Mycena alexandri]|uniref:Uncharacterized protein n=1 Tax=Mycena alexandri TaxID=1745969 RepID=A0AAD6SDJ6_9AGAR|nr:hypothetical protein C8F04DRAFT_1268578 [Mycena alexandri]
MFAFLSGQGRTAPFVELPSESTGGTFAPDEDAAASSVSRLHSPPQHQDEFDSDSDEGRNSSRDHELDLPLLQQQLNGVLQQAAQAAGKPADQAQINAKIVTIWRCRDLGETVIASLLQEYDEDVVSVVLARLGITPSSQSDHRSLMAGPRQQRSQGHHEPSRNPPSTTSHNRDFGVTAAHGPTRAADHPFRFTPWCESSSGSQRAKGKGSDVAAAYGSTRPANHSFGFTSTNTFNFYRSEATYDLHKPPQEATDIAHDADVYIHTNTQQRDPDNEIHKKDPYVGRQIWVFRGSTWVDESQTDLGGIVHPRLSERRLTVRMDGDPNWILVNSISTPMRLIKAIRAKSQLMAASTSD